MKAIQFELWTECNVGCKFCYLHKRARKTPKADKLREMQKVEDFLRAGDMKDYNIIGFIGGEFLQGQLHDLEVREKFFILLHIIRDLILEKKLDGMWLSASLTQDTFDLRETLDIFKDVKPEAPTGGFWLSTSYDTKFRFTLKTLSVWKNLMLGVKENYPNILCNTTMVLTQDLVEKYLSGEIRFQQFIDEYGTQLFFKPPHMIYDLFKSKPEMESKLPGFFPKRKDFLEFLTKVYDTEECWVFDKLCNLNFRADSLYRSDNEDPESREKGTLYEIAGSEYLPCGHHHSYGAYIDSKACMLCDKLKLK